MKVSFLSALVIFGALIIFMANSGLLTRIVLEYPLVLFIVSGVIISTMIFLFDFIFLGNSRLTDWSYFLKFMAVYCVIMAVVFVTFIPPLKMNTERIIFRPTENCNMFENPTRYVCFILGDKIYITTKRGCVGTVTNATSFYIISLWIPSKNQYRLKNKVFFHPENATDEAPKPPYWLPGNYCIQEYIDESSPSTHDRLRVSFISWTNSSVITSDSGYIERTHLEPYTTGWYKVSNCRWEVTRWLPFDGYCITGYVSNHYVNLPENMARLLHDNENLAKNN